MPAELTFDDHDPFAEEPEAVAPYPGRVDADMAADLGELKSEFQKSRGDARQRLRDLDDSDFWFTVVFESRGQKEAFLRAMGWLDHADKFLDGHVLADRENVILPPSALRPLHPKPDKKLRELAHPLGGQAAS